MTIDFDEAVYGTKKDIKIDVSEECSECHGKGGFDSKTCQECHGSGTITSEQRTMFGNFLSKTTCRKIMDFVLFSVFTPNSSKHLIFFGNSRNIHWLKYLRFDTR